MSQPATWRVLANGVSIKRPGAFEAMQHGACTRLLGVHLINGAGHSLAEEQPEEVNKLLIGFLRQVAIG